ncbi:MULTISPECIES: 6-phosphofructokinase [Chryseobacterium]|jgi:6-phosphofructokinase 1|uniref:ATP-dependent 6-phosphofructokinase n=2 Tax=Chryseobacterium aquaticum TaxID=452084 RepID=A0A0Q3KQT5_9FLAO|nr:MULTISPECIES: 6-phosphofructokinase [Chryseobacterium]KNB62777.1 6-phosphofructokinase [Chryseobacterium sp. Hurlbut01]KQK26620.1 6-phosphofructokinase [Chryseobacterium aquaticum]KUJ57091.1 6-phosphofructokinase [Chryseobacterium aquaticum subsp. greenlandense]NMR35607.1 6-phosphofructokinase [Chryseobacterium aquaticum]NRQ47682.1 6-phosphofructokinase [Chryseobacterium sp. C-204]
MRESAVKKIAVLTSGGDSPGMNAALRAVVRTANYYNIECYGVREGYNGLIHDDFLKMGPRSVKNIINQGGTILKSARSKEFMTKEGRQKAYDNCVKYGIDALVCIGGDGTFTGAKIFNEEFGIKVIGVPGTIDNDIFGTDNTIGYDTALNTAMDAIDKIRDTATSHNRVFFVEVMGRDAGFIALNSGLATGALDILIPEKKDSMDELFATFRNAEKTGKASSIVVVAEGEKLGNIYELAEQTKAEFPEYDIRVAILGHIQRGGSPSCADRVLASRLGYGAVVGLMDGQNNVMAGMRSNDIVYTEIEEAIKKHNEINKDLLLISEILAI